MSLSPKTGQMVKVEESPATMGSRALKGEDNEKEETQVFGVTVKSRDLQSYSYDNNGNLTSKGTESFTYDWIFVLSSVRG